ncbi:MAG: glycosyltransferase family 39 protein [Holosporaceae bacterium]|jgi:4-amino-4-deoxy-L-arabinose transferase-like glycosyltransferase|nr:glycosyltransferase family 39 protein [Holosporaceae bacterium]
MKNNEISPSQVKTKQSNHLVGFFKDIDHLKVTLLLLTVLSIFFCHEIGNRNFADPDEGRYVEIPREMVASGDYITPRLNGLKYFEKPVLFYWLQALSIHAFGINEISMRLWLAIFAVLGCLVLFGIGIARYSKSTGLMAAGILATTLLYYAHSRLIILDLALSVFMCGSLWCFYLAFVKPPTKFDNATSSSAVSKSLIVAMYALAALACLTKGLIGAALPGMVALLWIILTNGWHRLRQLFYVPGLLVFLAIFLPWHLLIMQHNNDFFDFYFIFEHFTRYTTKVHNRYQPWWFFLPIVLVGLFPWTGFAMVAIKNSIAKAMTAPVAKKRQNDANNTCVAKVSDNYFAAEQVFFLVWIFTIFVFFSFSNSKLVPYILPIIPPIAFLTACSLENSNPVTTFRNFRHGALLNMFLFAIVGLVFFMEKHKITDILQNEDASLLVYMIFASMAMMVIVQVSAMIRKVSIRHATWLQVLLAANIMGLLNKGAVLYQDVKKPSTKQFAQLVNWNRTKDDLVFCYKKYYQDFPVYLQSTVGVVDFVGELQFGMEAAKRDGTLSPYHMMGDDEFWKLWNSGSNRIFLLSPRQEYNKLFVSRSNRHKLIHFDKHFALITNK